MNPILQKMNQNNSSVIKDVLKGNPNEAFNRMIRTNPQFAEFVRSNQGKSFDQIAKENGLDINMIKNMLK